MFGSSLCKVSQSQSICMLLNNLMSSTESNSSEVSTQGTVSFIKNEEQQGAHDWSLRNGGICKKEFGETVIIANSVTCSGNLLRESSATCLSGKYSRPRCAVRAGRGLPGAGSWPAARVTASERSRRAKPPSPASDLRPSPLFTTARPNSLNLPSSSFLVRSSTMTIRLR